MEVKVTKCKNGHYYDTNKYEVCPHCGAGEFTIEQPQKKRFGFFKKNAAEKTTVNPTSIQFSKEIPSSTEELVFEDVETAGIYAPEQLQVEDVQTQGVFATAQNDETITNNDYLTQNSDTVEDNGLTSGFFAAKPESKTQVEQRKVTDRDEEKTTGYFSAPAQAETRLPSLQEQVKAATDSNDVKTTGFFAVKTSSGIAENSPVSTSTEPPVGWLVCVAGKNLGKDYRIVAGKNSIGRTQDNTVCLTGEISVSRDKHAWVIFEPRKQKFYLKPGDGSGLVYLNDENVFDTTALHSGDVLELGDVKLVFIALCGESFNWADYISKE